MQVVSSLRLPTADPLGVCVSPGQTVRQSGKICVRTSRVLTKVKNAKYGDYSFFIPVITSYC